MERVECREIRHSYDGVRDAVRGVNLKVERGEVLALIGPNGAGKSTLLRILATLQQPDEGSVLWDGTDAWGARYALRRKIGFLGDGTSLYPSMTAASYLRFFAECYGFRGRDVHARVGSVLAMFDLTSRADATVADLSKGMRQRLAIGRTMLHRPQLLLLDEPADGLDPRARRQLRSTLRAVADEGVAIVVSSHILRELDRFVDTVALLQQGEVEVQGSVENVISTHDVGRRLHHVEVIAGLSAALEVLRTHEGLIESIEPLHPSERGIAAGASDCGRIKVRIHGDARKAAGLLRELVLANVEVSAMAKVRSDLEDVYQSVGHDEVS